MTAALHITVPPVPRETSQQQADRLLQAHRESRGLPYKVCTGRGVGLGSVQSRADFRNEAEAWAEYLALTAEVRGHEGQWVQMTEGVFPFEQIVVSEVMDARPQGPVDTRHPIERMLARQIAAGVKPLVIGDVL